MDILIQDLQKSLNSEDPVLLIDVRTHKELNEVGQVSIEALLFTSIKMCQKTIKGRNWLE